MFLLHFSFPLVSGPSRMQNQKKKRKKKKRNEISFRCETTQLHNERKWNGENPPPPIYASHCPNLDTKKQQPKSFFFISYLISIHRVCFYAHSRATPELNIGRLRYDSTVQGRAIQLLPFFLLKFPFQMFVFFLRCSQILLFFFSLALFDFLCRLLVFA